MTHPGLLRFILPTLLVTGCASWEDPSRDPSFKLVEPLSWNTERVELDGVAFAEGSEISVSAFRNRFGFTPPGDWQLESSDPSVIRVASGPGAVAVAAGPGSATLALRDEVGTVVLSGAVSVMEPDRAELELQLPCPPEDPDVARQLRSDSANVMVNGEEVSYVITGFYAGETRLVASLPTVTARDSDNYDYDDYYGYTGSTYIYAVPSLGAQSYDVTLGDNTVPLVVGVVESQDINSLEFVKEPNHFVVARGRLASRAVVDGLPVDWEIDGESVSASGYALHQDGCVDCSEVPVRASLGDALSVEALLVVDEFALGTDQMIATH